MSIQEKLRTKYPGLYKSMIYLNNTLRAKSFHRKSFSQFGEDMLIDPLFDNNHKGFYVDVGAHRPSQRSNTYYFYLQGWKGINIEAMPGSKKLFDTVRPKDINIEAGVSDQNGTLSYYQLNQPLMNGFYENDEQISQHEGVKILNKIDIKMSTLADILDEHLPKKQEIDFMSIDVEGLDFQVIKSNNWDKYRPKVLLVEILDFQLDKIESYEIHQFLSEKGYHFYSRTVHTLVYTLKQ